MYCDKSPTADFLALDSIEPLPKLTFQPDESNIPAPPVNGLITLEGPAAPPVRFGSPSMSIFQHQNGQ